MTRTFIAIALTALAFIPSAQADLPKELDCFKYSTELQLAIAIAISPRSPPIHMHLNRSFGTRPIIFGTTSLPDGAILSITLTKPRLPDAEERSSIGLPECKDNCIPTWDLVAVKNGAFRTIPLSFGTANPLEPGIYPIEIAVALCNVNGPHPTLEHVIYTGQIVIGANDR